MKRKLREVCSIVLAGIMTLNLSMPTAMTVLADETNNFVPEIGVSGEIELEDLKWYYTAFGQSTDLMFHNSSSTLTLEQDGINNVWINPDWIASKSDAPHMYDIVSAGGNSYDSRASFIPNAEQMAEALEYGVPYSIDGSDTILLESRGGKITGGHDGMTFFYTALPTDGNYKITADIMQMTAGPHPNSSSGQTGGTASSQAASGVMARDSISPNRKVPYENGFEEIPAISNFAGVGFRRDRSPSGIARDGAVDQTNTIGVPNTVFYDNGNHGAVNGYSAGITYSVTLERKDEGFFYSVNAETGVGTIPETRVDTSTSNNRANADLVKRIDEDVMYWGFFAARENRLVVSNVSLEYTGESNCVATVPPGSTDRYPNAVIESRHRSATTRENMILSLRPNYDGTLIVKNLATNEIVFNGTVVNYDEKFIEVSLAMGVNQFSYEFETTDTNARTNSANGTINVTRNTALPTTELEAVWAGTAARGLGDGTSKANAMILSDAINAAEPGQSVYLIAEDDFSNETITVTQNNSGEPTDLVDEPWDDPYDDTDTPNYVTIQPEPGVENIRIKNIRSSGGKVYFIHFKGFITGGNSSLDRFSEGNGIPVSVAGDYNLYENLTAQWSTGSGFGGANSDDTTFNRGWVKYNTWLNCTAFRNEDANMQDSDGFQLQRAGRGNYYIGCDASYAGDDGWDHFLRVNMGGGFPIVFDNCVAFRNNANGFKVGGEGQPADSILINCLAYENGMAGFSDNFNPGHLQLINCVSVDNAKQNYILRDNPIIIPRQELINSISFRTRTQAETYTDAIAGSVINSAIIKEADSIISTYDDGTILTEDMFVSVDSQYAFSRDENNNLVFGDYMRLIETDDNIGNNGSNNGSSGSGSGSSIIKAKTNSNVTSGVWQLDENGWWLKTATGYAKNEWVSLESKWYYFNEEGYAVVGWVQVADKWYYLNSDCQMETGWVQSENKWYFLNSNGDMKTGWIELNGQWYFLNNSGSMATGWNFISEKWYFLNDNGDMAYSTTVDGYTVNDMGEWIS